MRELVSRDLHAVKLSSIVLLIPALSLASVTLFACDESGSSGAGAPCINDLQCGVGLECSGRVCVPAQACDVATPCAGGETCLAGTCRLACAADVNCVERGLYCDTTAGLCLPKSNDAVTGAGGSATGAGGASGGGGAPAGGSAGGPGGSGGGPVVSMPTLELIDDLEDGDSRILERGGRTGPWYVVTDGQAGPSSTGALLPEDSGGKAIFFRLSGDSSSWGSGVQVDFNNPGSDAKAPGRATLDASSFTGLTFRAKGKGVVRFKVNTASIVAMNEGGDCSGECFNAHGATLPLSSAWKQYVVLFEPTTGVVPEGDKLSLAQEADWGVKASFDAAELMGLAFQSNKAFEIWLDDVAFFTAGLKPSGDGGGDSGSSCADDYWPGAPAGSVTRYDFVQGTELPACAYVVTNKGAGVDGDWDTVEGISTGDGGYFGAMNTEDFAAGAACGACVELEHQGRSVTITIVDECPIGSNPICTKGHIDLSRKAIRELEPNRSLESLTGVPWRYVSCPTTGNVQMRLHPNANGGWQPVIIENGIYPIESVSLNGVPAARSGNMMGGNAWVAPGQSPPYQVRAVDVAGNVLEASFSGGSSLLDVGSQFSCN